MKNLEYRMYGLVPYNLSDIQKGIQFGHAVVEYANKFGKNRAYRKWAEQDKTFIILNGGTTNNAGISKFILGARNFAGYWGENGETSRGKKLNLSEPGSLQVHCHALQEMGVEVVPFFEPDLNEALTAVVFLVDERVFDRTTYPDFNIPGKIEGLWGTMREEQRTPFKRTFKKEWNKWVKSVGGVSNAMLRDYIRNLKLA